MYRNTTLGNTLQETLDEFIQCGQISNALASKILVQFDKSINNALSSRIKNRLSFKVKLIRSWIPLSMLINCVLILKQAGHLKTYRFCDNVWTFVLKEVEFRDVQELVKVDKVKIVACDGKGAVMTKDDRDWRLSFSTDLSKTDYSWKHVSNRMTNPI